MFKLGIHEVTKENKEKYLNQIADLEIKVLNDMESKGRIGQLFITGKEDIEEYIDSKENTVIVVTDEKEKVIAAAYITQNQMPFTYNDITKYFKYGDNYKEYVKSLYSSNEEYKLDMLKAHEIKMKAYEYASKKVLSEHNEFNSIHKFLKHELDEKTNRFHEKSVLRDSINRYMSEYIDKNFPEKKELYEKFYWMTIKDIEAEFHRKIDIDREHEEIIDNGQLKIYNNPRFDIEKYYDSNTANAVEIDTYITDPEDRQYGLARIIVFEGVRKHIERHFENEKNKEIFLCSTLHKDNLSSKYVSEFFGLKDKLYVNRRQGRDREVHICKILREDAKQYLEDMEKRLIVLYGYNPKNKEISDKEKIGILKEQLEYEKAEVDRLKVITHKRKIRFKSKKNYLKEKRTKVNNLEKMIKDIKDIKNNKNMKNTMEETESER